MWSVGAGPAKSADLGPERAGGPRAQTLSPRKISLTDVHRIAQLARIEIDAGQADDVRAKLEAIFGLISELAAVDTAGVVPMAHAQDVVLPLRLDRVTDADHRASYLALAPAVEDGLYLVPKVLE